MRRYAILSLAILLAACGGDGSGGGSPGTPATGYFKDSNTQGVRYVAGSHSGITGADGSFTYEVGRPVYFYLGAGTNVPLGSIAVGQTIVTPVDLVTGGATIHRAVLNLARFLMMLDTDGDPSNGITISPAVQDAAAGWGTVNFDQTDTAFTSAVDPIRTSLGATLPTSLAARTHLEATLRCARSGGFRGSYSGGESGRFGVLVNAASGNVEGLGYSTTLTQVFAITGTTSMTLDQTAGFTSGAATTGATYTGRLTSADTVAGTWSNTPLSGSFSGSRVGGALNAKYRFTGQFQNDGPLTSYGLYTLDIDGSAHVTGYAYDIASDSVETLTGSVTGSGTMLNGTTSSGATVSATINLAAGTVSGGSWLKGAVTGTFTASGCQLN